MSLVLNSNENWTLKESVWFIWYPDVNQILLKPIAWNEVLWIRTPSECAEVWSTTKVWININWTIVNYLCQKLVSPYMFLWWNANYWYWSCWCIKWWWNSYRIWINWWFSWWEIIWKDLRWKSVIANNDATQTHSNKIHYAKVRLLHQDWTFTDIWELWSMTAQAPDYWNDKIFYYNYNNFTACAIKMLQTTTSWIVAQAGDRVVADVYISNNDTVVFWNDWSCCSNAITANISYVAQIEFTWIAPNPIQVSID